jgi:hypothetical protein
VHINVYYKKLGGLSNITAIAKYTRYEPPPSAVDLIWAVAETYRTIISIQGIALPPFQEMSWELCGNFYISRLINLDIGCPQCL